MIKLGAGFDTNRFELHDAVRLDQFSEPNEKARIVRIDPGPPNFFGRLAGAENQQSGTEQRLKKRS